jgi:hypothetical protein
MPRLILGAVLALALAGCGGGGSTPPLPIPTPTPTPTPCPPTQAPQVCDPGLVTPPGIAGHARKEG